jgi:hypothetical protein
VDVVLGCDRVDFPGIQGAVADDRGSGLEQVLQVALPSARRGDLQHRFAEIEEFARIECLERVGSRQALAHYLNHVGEVLATDRGLSASIEAVRGSAESEPRGEARARLEVIVGKIIERGQAVGAVRHTCTVADVYMIVDALSAVIRTGSGDWRRFLDITLNGLHNR